MSEKGRFMVVFSSPEKPMVTCTVHDYGDSAGEVYASRTFSLDEQGLAVYGQMDARADLLMPASDVGSQLQSLISQFAEENGIVPEEIHHSTRIEGKVVERDGLVLASAWHDPTLIRKIQKEW